MKNKSLLLTIPILLITMSSVAQKTLIKVQQWEVNRDIPKLVKALGNEDYLIVVASAKALVKIGKPTVANLITFIEENKKGDGGYAALVLGNIGSEAKASIPVLIEKTPESYEGEFFNGSKFGTPIDSRFLIPCTLSSTIRSSIVGVPQPVKTYSFNEVRVEAWAWALCKITTQDFGNDRMKWTEWWEKSKNQ